MSVYYNEIDRNAAAWTRELIKGGHIAEGIVDERSIEEVTPADVAEFRQCHFFSGIAGWQYASRLAGIGDGGLDDGLASRSDGSVVKSDHSDAIWTGSCPCQPFSGAWRRKGTADARHLWPAWFRLIRECRPRLVVGEQVSSGDGLAWFDVVCDDLEGAGYAVGALDIPAASIGAPHRRQRLYWLAYACRKRREGLGLHVRERRSESDLPEVGGGAARIMGDASRDGARKHRRELPRDEAQHEVGAKNSDHPPIATSTNDLTQGFWRDAEWRDCSDGKARPIEPGCEPLVDGFPGRVELLRGYGNAIVAEQAAAFLRAALQVIAEIETASAASDATA